MKRKEPKFKYRHVMLLDDNELDNFINKKVIESTNFSSKIYLNTSGQSALEFLNNLSVADSEAPNIYPELIFVDLNMPMMDGFQFINHLKTSGKKHWEKLKLVILTSSVHDDDRRKANEISKGIIFLNKPLTENMLAQL